MVTRKQTSQKSQTNIAIRRGLKFIQKFGSTRKSFERYGALLIFCFALLSATSREERKQTAQQQALALAKRWRRTHRRLPQTPSSDLILESAIVCYALARIGQPNSKLRKEIAVAVNKMDVTDLLGFDPTSEPPPDNLPFDCDCGATNKRGRKTCRQCRSRLEYRTRYRVWMEVLAKTYLGEQCGFIFGVAYVDVLKWLPRMRPYPIFTDTSKDDNEQLFDALYAVTHLIYTLNDYNTRKLDPRCLPAEFAFLKKNVKTCLLQKNTEVLGELLDSLKAFGLSLTHALLRQGTDYLLAHQNEDGSWGDTGEDDAETRCHTTWTAIDGLRGWAWRGKKLSSRVTEELLSRSSSSLASSGKRRRASNRKYL
ncbi:MAG TPA: hypothetical protein VLL54_09800 [Pyrinomonadaceae bacterium]|nr:hypothetical protein [Pyrinomonadaceae bacterium]